MSFMNTCMIGIKTYLNGEYGLKKTFWFGLVIGGVVISRLAYMLQSAIWRLYDGDKIISAVILQFIVVGFFIAIMGLAVGVLFASFHKRDPGFGGWLACAVSSFVILAALISIIEATTSIRTDGESYGWPFGRDYRQFAHRGDVPFYVDRLLENNNITSLSLTLVTNLGARTDTALALAQNGDATRLESENQIMKQICDYARFARHSAISHAVISVTIANGEDRTLIIAPSECEDIR